MRDSKRFSTRFLLPIAAIAGVTIIAVTGFLAWSAHRIDTDALQRETRLLRRALDEEKARMLTAIEEMAVWDDVVSAYEDQDLNWLSENIGTTAY